MTKVSNYDFSCDLYAEVAKARSKFPNTTDMMTSLTEEVGELAQALLKNKYEGGWHYAIYNEAVQVAAMAMRLATEGDSNFPYDPETGYRNSQSKDGDTNWQPSSLASMPSKDWENPDLRPGVSLEEMKKHKERLEALRDAE